MNGPIDTLTATVTDVHTGWDMRPTVHSIATVVSQIMSRSMQSQVGIESVGAIFVDTAARTGRDVTDVTGVDVAREVTDAILPTAVQ